MFTCCCFLSFLSLFSCLDIFLSISLPVFFFFTLWFYFYFSFLTFFPFSLSLLFPFFITLSSIFFILFIFPFYLFCIINIFEKRYLFPYAYHIGGNFEEKSVLKEYIIAISILEILQDNTKHPIVHLIAPLLPWKGRESFSALIGLKLWLFQKHSYKISYSNF